MKRYATTIEVYDMLAAKVVYINAVYEAEDRSDLVTKVRNAHGSRAEVISSKEIRSKV